MNRHETFIKTLEGVNTGMYASVAKAAGFDEATLKEMVDELKSKLRVRGGIARADYSDQEIADLAVKAVSSDNPATVERCVDDISKGTQKLKQDPDYELRALIGDYFGLKAVERYEKQRQIMGQWHREQFAKYGSRYLGMKMKGELVPPNLDEAPGGI